MAELLAIVPARGGSKGIKRKNLQIVAGKPLVLHVLDTLVDVSVDRIVCTTDDPEIASVVGLHGYEVHHRTPETSSDEATIDQVIDEVVTDLEWDGDVLMVQPTVPQIDAYTLNEFLGTRDDHHRIWVFVDEHRHLTWQSGEPLTGRVNRQENIDWPLNEIGVRYYTNGKTGPPDGLYQIPTPITDIDTLADLETVRQSLHRTTICFRYIANKRTGAGHLHRCLQLANELQHHQITFSPMPLTDVWAFNTVKRYGWDTVMSTHGAGLVINDILDTEPMDVLPFIQRGQKVINLEDHGPGGRYADLVINALYHPRREEKQGRFYYGPDYAVLRSEFIGLPEFPIRTRRDRTHPRVLMLFGGTDPSGLGDRFEQVLVGPGVGAAYPVTRIRPGMSVAQEMCTHDILITSAGRTVYEAAAVGIPTIVLAQNQRETTHAHLANTINLGLGSFVGDYDVVRAVRTLWDSPDLREELSVRSRRSVDGLGGRRIARLADGLLEGL